MRLNTSKKSNQATTYEGAKAALISPLEQLERSVMACLLWENSFYESGEDVAERVKSLIKTLVTETPRLTNTLGVIALIKKAKNEMHLRHMPLYMTVCLIESDVKGKMIGDLIYEVVQRPDELSEFLAIYWRNGKRPLTWQMKVGLGRAFHKFDEFQFAKYNRDSEIKLCDVMALVHPIPKNKEEERVYKAIADGNLKTPDTWEVALSSGKDKKETFIRLMQENKLGGLAFLRNLRNMREAKVDPVIIRRYFSKANFEKVLPFRFVAAANTNPEIEPAIEEAMLKSLESIPKLPGKTVLLVDNSGSMSDLLSKKSDMTRFDAAAALAILLRGICDDVQIISFSSNAAIVPPRTGFALRDAIRRAIPVAGTDTDMAIRVANREDYDRIILITDEQSYSDYRKVKSEKAYCINVAHYKNGIGYGDWVHIDGFSDSILNYIVAYEGLTSKDR